MTTFFWPLVGIFWFVATRFAAPWLAHRGGNLPALDALCKRFGAVVLGLCLVLWAIQLSAGAVESARMDSWPAPQRWLALATVLLAFLAAAAWILLGRGGRSLADAFGTGEAKVKIAASVVLLVATVQNATLYVA